jgi:hypothetical protein
MNSKINAKSIKCHKCYIDLTEIDALPCYYPESVITYYSCNKCQEDCFICTENLTTYNRLQCKYGHICCRNCVQKIAVNKNLINCKWDDIFKCTICDDILSKRESHVDMHIDIITHKGKKYIVIPNEIQEEKTTYWIGSAISPRRDFGHMYATLNDKILVICVENINEPNHYFTIVKVKWERLNPRVIATYGLFLL